MARETPLEKHPKTIEVQCLTSSIHQRVWICEQTISHLKVLKRRNCLSERFKHESPAGGFKSHDFLKTSTVIGVSSYVKCICICMCISICLYVCVYIFIVYTEIHISNDISYPNIKHVQIRCLKSLYYLWSWRILEVNGPTHKLWTTMSIAPAQLPFLPQKSQRSPLPPGTAFVTLVDNSVKVKWQNI